jgi:hypothetical protein
MNRRMISFALAALLAATLAGSARAQPPPPYTAQTDTHYQAMDGTGSADAYVSLTGAYYNGANFCRHAIGHRRFRNVFGVTLYDYTENVFWCWNGSTIRNFYRDRGPASVTVLSAWNFKGNIGSNCIYEHCSGRGVGSWATTADTKGQYEACIVWFCNSRYPYIAVTVYGNGSASLASSG